MHGDNCEGKSDSKKVSEWKKKRLFSSSQGLIMLWHGQFKKSHVSRKLAQPVWTAAEPSVSHSLSRADCIVQHSTLRTPGQLFDHKHFQYNDLDSQFLND